MEKNTTIKDNKNIKKKNILIGIIIFVFLIVISIMLVYMGGKEVDDINKPILAKKKHDKMLYYMNKKYDDKFTFNAPFGGSVGVDSTQITVKSSKYPDKKIWVEYVVENGEEQYYDNYIDYKYENETKDYLLEVMCGIFEDANVVVEYNVDSGGTRNNYDNLTTFEEYIKGESNPVVFSAYVDVEIKEPDQVKISNLISTRFVDELNMKVIGKIYFEKSENSLFFITDDVGIKMQKWS